MSLWQQIKQIFQPKQSEDAWIELDGTLRDNYREFFADLVDDVLQANNLRGKLCEPLMVEPSPNQWGKSRQEFRGVVCKSLLARISTSDLTAMQGGQSGIFGDFSKFPGADQSGELRKAMETRQFRLVMGKTQRGIRVVGVAILT